MKEGKNQSQRRREQTPSSNRRVSLSEIVGRAVASVKSTKVIAFRVFFTVLAAASCFVLLGVSKQRQPNADSAQMIIELKQHSSMLLSDEELERNACRYLSKSMPLLLKDLRKHPNDNGLASFASRADGAHFKFSGLTNSLIRQSFSGKNLVFLGDSTMKHVFVWLKALLGQKLAVDHNNNSNNGNVSRSNRSNFDLSQSTLYDSIGWLGPNLTTDFYIPFQHFDRKENTHTRMEWYNIGNLTNLTATWDRMYSNYHGKVDVLVANMGMHWMHFYPARNATLEGMHRWIHYEQFFNEVWNKAKELGVKLLVLKTTNLICEKRYFGNLSKFNQLYSSNDPSTLRTCQEQMLFNSSTSTTLEQDLANYCQNGTFNEHGVSHLNKRLDNWFLERFSKEIKNNYHSTTHTNNTNSSPIMPQMVIFRDHDVESCGFTNYGDGRHYKFLSLLRIRLLANLIDCRYPRSSSDIDGDSALLDSLRWNE